MAQRLRHRELMDEVAPNIWLGQFESALDDQISNLESLNVTHVVSLGCFYGWWSLRTKPKHLLIPIEDKPHVFITDYFNDVFRFMDEALDNHCGVLVHCEQGRSRSGAMVIAYLMKKDRQPYPDVLNRVLAHRKRVMPNIGFQIQLRAFARNGFNTSIKYSEVLNLQAELKSALRNLREQVLALQLHIQKSEKIFVTLGHDGSNKNRLDDDPDSGVRYPSTTIDTRSPFDPEMSGKSPDLRPHYPFEWWTSADETDNPVHWGKDVQVGLTTQDLVSFRKEWVLLVFLCHQFQLYGIPVNTEILSVLNIIGEMYFEELLETFQEVFTPVQRALDNAIHPTSSAPTGPTSAPVTHTKNSFPPSASPRSAGIPSGPSTSSRPIRQTASGPAQSDIRGGPSVSTQMPRSRGPGSAPSAVMGRTTGIPSQQMNSARSPRSAAGAGVHILRRAGPDPPQTKQQTFVGAGALGYRAAPAARVPDSQW